MNKTKLSLMAGLLIVVAGVVSSEAQAQIVMFGPPIVGPRIVARAVVPGPVAVYRPIVAAPLVTTYRPAVPTYNAYRPVAAPYYAPRVYAAPALVTTRIRPAVIGPGIGGFPNVYVPGQPLRNAVRFVVP